jgi:hypothetical protein
MAQVDMILILHQAFVAKEGVELAVLLDADFHYWFIEMLFAKQLHVKHLV